ncbi:hypothetical protein MMC16_004947 [Acarospora aff. strigata]|nr:hypothetical protein [Acarospora aff. strigata]
MAPESTALVTRDPNESPYQLVTNQTLKASTALLKHIKSEAKRKETESTTKNLLANHDNGSDEDASADNDEPIWLTLTTKKHIVDKKRLKPGKITVPHSLNSSPSSTVCLITADPQRAFKDTIAHASFPPALSKRITRVIGMKKLQGRYKSFESRRQLLHEHDVFLADDRIITRLPQVLGKTFYKGSKKPVPVNLEAYKPKDANGKRQKPDKTDGNKRAVVAQPQQVAREIERTLSAAQVYPSPSATTSVRIGLASFTPQQLVENIEAVVAGLVEKFVTKKWRNVRAVHIKGPNTMALPVWLADELWVDERDVLDDEEAARAIEAGQQKGKKRKVRDGEATDVAEDQTQVKVQSAEPKAKKPKKIEDTGTSKPEGADRKAKKIKKIEDADMNKEMALRREKLRAQKAEAREAADGDVISVKKTKVVKTTTDGKVKVKTKKTSVVAVP